MLLGGVLLGEYYCIDFGKNAKKNIQAKKKGVLQYTKDTQVLEDHLLGKS